MRRATDKNPKQLTFWQSVAEVYLQAGDREISNGEMYRIACERAGVSESDFDRRLPIGSAGAEHKPMARTARWVQQTLKMRHVLERVPEKRGVWRLTKEAKTRLHRVERGFVILGLSTRLGVALWADCRDAMSVLDEPISLLLTSPPYALNRPRAYGNPPASEYVDFICSLIEPVLPKLARGASVVLNVSSDIFLKGLPARELLVERLTIALHDRLGLYKMDQLIWHSPNKAPAPVQWASIRRIQLNTAWEPLLWLTLDPLHTFADNRRVLEPHTERHEKLNARGGEGRLAEFTDGRYRIRPGSFSNPTAGRIPRNVLTFSTTCAGQRAYKQSARDLGLPVHGAPWPESLVDFLVRYLTAEGMLVADICAGSLTTPAVCERLNRRWFATELMAEYIRGGASRLPDVWINPDIDRVIYGPSEDRT